MSNYLIHFILSLFFAESLLFLFRHRLSPLYLTLGLLIVPATSYALFYNFNLGLIQSNLVYAIGYAGALWAVFSFFLLTSFHRDHIHDNQKFVIIKEIILLFIQCILIVLFFIVPWAIDTFPLSNPEAVLFTLFSPITGANNFIVDTFKEKVITSSLTTFFSLLAIQQIISQSLFKSKISGSFHKGPLSFHLSSDKNRKMSFFHVTKLTSFLLFGVVFINLLLLPCIIKNAPFEALFGSKIDSTLYKKHFEDPKEAISLAQKNLIVIFLESMTNNFSKYTPELNSWKEKGISFNPGGTSVSGTSWTIAGITSALCGIPLNMPLTDEEYTGKLPTYLPNAICIMDLMKNARYNQLSIQGSSANFTQIRDFWTAHGNVEIRDNLHYERTKEIPPNYNVFWGMEDKKTLAFAQQSLDSLAKLSNPFALYISTIDTHQPDGYLDSSCQHNEENQYKNVLRCSSSMIGEFLSWIQKQSWFENTVVAVVGDHIIQGLAAKAGLPQNEELYTTAFFINSGFENKNSQRSFSNLDYAPSILEALGWELPHHGFGLGRSLFSNEKTMLEIYGLDSLNTLLRQRSIQYDHFLYGN